METRRNFRSGIDEITGFGGNREDFLDLYWEDDMVARQRDARGRRSAPTLTSQIEDILRRSF